jgi:hypothetical protein
MGATYRSKTDHTGKAVTAASWLAEMESQNADRYEVVRKNGTKWRMYKSKETGKKFIAVYLWNSQNGEIGYKVFGHDEHPYYYDCPLSWLDDVDLSGEHAKAWAEQVREYHKRATQTYTEGMRIRLDYLIPGSLYKSKAEMEAITDSEHKDGIYATVQYLRKPSQLIYRCEKSGAIYRLNPKTDKFTVL